MKTAAFYILIQVLYYMAEMSRRTDEENRMDKPEASFKVYMPLLQSCCCLVCSTRQEKEPYLA